MLLNRLSKLEESLDDARALHRMIDKHPVVVKMKDKIAQLKEQIAGTPQHLPEWVGREEPLTDEEIRRSNEEFRKEWIRRQQQHIELVAVKAHLDALERDLANRQKELKEWKNVEARFRPTWDAYRRLKRKVTEREAQLASAQANLDNVETKYSAEVARKTRSLHGIWADPVPVRPSAPHASTVIGLAVILGVWGGLLVAIRPPGIGLRGKVILATATLLLIAGAVFLGWSNSLRLDDPARFAELWGWVSPA